MSMTQYVNGAVGRHLLVDGKLAVHEADEIASADLRSRPDIISVKVWLPDGTLAWTNLAPERIGRRFPVQGHLAEALEGAAEAEFESFAEASAEQEAEASLGEHLLEVYAPVTGPGGEVAGAYEIYADSSALEASIASRSRLVWGVTAGVFLAIWVALVLLVREASRRMRAQTAKLRTRSRELLESYRQLEQSSLEAIESLNATVEAKDPYTAGHSKRVQRVAVAVAVELGFAGERLEAIRLASLLHDIGKLAVPDAVLTKPAALTPSEFELIKRHSEEGARIVGKLARLQTALPIIRHHHERWDGTGYPAALAGGEIPPEALVVGLADAWDAMTTDRPYHRALTLEEATREVREGRGRQFAPEVVDAFLTVLRRRPGEILASNVPDDRAALAG